MEKAKSKLLKEIADVLVDLTLQYGESSLRDLVEYEVIRNLGETWSLLAPDSPAVEWSDVISKLQWDKRVTLKDDGNALDNILTPSGSVTKKSGNLLRLQSLEIDLRCNVIKEITHQTSAVPVHEIAAMNKWDKWTKSICKICPSHEFNWSEFIGNNADVLGALPHWKEMDIQHYSLPNIRKRRSTNDHDNVIKKKLKAVGSISPIHHPAEDDQILFSDHSYSTENNNHTTEQCPEGILCESDEETSSNAVFEDSDDIPAKDILVTRRFSDDDADGQHPAVHEIRVDIHTEKSISEDGEKQMYDSRDSRQTRKVDDRKRNNEGHSTRKYKDLSRCHSAKILKILTKTCSGRQANELDRLLNQNTFSRTEIHLLVSGIVKAISCDHCDYILDVILQSPDFNVIHIVSHLTQLYTQSFISPSDKEFMDNCMVLLDRLLATGHKSHKIVSPVLQILERIVKEKLKNRELEYTLMNLRQQIRLGIGVNEYVSTTVNFREIDIFPSYSDMEYPVNLRKNIEKGPFKNLNQYLEVHFRLLREDCVAPIREVIRKYNENRSRIRGQREQQLKLYEHVHILHGMCVSGGSGGIAFRVQFSIKPFRHVHWQSTNRLKYVSLVCLSSDGFKTFTFASVAERKVHDLQKGVIVLNFERNWMGIVKEYSNAEFIMAESSGYFESYRHVLLALQATHGTNLPFQKYLISCETLVNQPAYLKHENGNQIDFGPLMMEKSGVKLANVLEPDTWPSNIELGLDEFQMRALKTALTKEFCIIQGPPGTGKTFIGLKIVQALLHNKIQWNTLWLHNRPLRPLLVVCYTNHALDQFLEGILTFQKTQIVRVGGRCKSETIKPYLLSSIKEQRHKETVSKEVNYTWGRMMSLKHEINTLASQIHSTEIGILHKKILETYMTQDHEIQLTIDALLNSDLQMPRECENDLRNAWYEGVKFSLLLEWLNCGNILQAFEYDYHDVERSRQEHTANLAHFDGNDYEYNNHNDDNKRNADAHQQQKIFDDVIKNNILLNTLVSDKNPEMQDKKNMAKCLLQDTGYMSKEESLSIRSIWTLALKDRWRLYKYWIMMYKSKLYSDINTMVFEYRSVHKRYNRIVHDEEKDIMQGATVLAMTTTCAARYHRVLQEIGPKVIVIEEAAEVLESHVITTMTKECEHLIMIGDHKQLWPSVTTGKLAKKYKLDISLFERMVNNGIQLDALVYQHRMRPEISQLVAGFYSDLRNHSSVSDYPKIKGVGANMYFINHDKCESTHGDLISKSNMHEVHFLEALCRYLLQQGYEGSQITLLTFYTGQLLEMKKNMPKEEFEGVRICTVDNFQGEENDIILLSLVRSNDRNQIGFASVENRVCVALSRAKQGLFVIGNFDHFRKCSTMWSKLIDFVHDRGGLVDAIPLYCQNHPDTRIHAAEAEDFSNAPDGGCLLQCEARLYCGHRCVRKCHSYDADHLSYRCMKTCNKILCEMNHRCPKLCFQDCSACVEDVIKVIPICGHKQIVPCHIEPEDWMCEETVQKTWSCGHTSATPCHINTMLETCSLPCRETLECGHPCSGNCTSCFNGRFHYGCKSKCERQLVCGHLCIESCSENCPPCQQKCRNRCVHSRCMKRCSEPCAPCMEPCEWQCQHYKCTKLCSEPCDRPRCDEPCTKMLKCDHLCIGLCGESCPEKCRECNEDEVTSIFFGTEEDPEARFIQLRDCSRKCLVEVSALDQWMDMDTNDNSIVQRKCCPKCKTPILNNTRYGNILNRIQNDIGQAKTKIAGNEIQKRQRKATNLLSLNDIIEDTAAYEELLSRVSCDRITAMEHQHISNQITFLTHIGMCVKTIRDHFISNSMCKFPISKLQRDLMMLRDSVLRHQRIFTQQQLSECKMEITRLHLVIQTRIAENACSEANKHAKSRVKNLLRTLESGEPLTVCNEEMLKKELENVKKLCGGLQISDNERKMILQTMAFSKGHWFKCPNGHIYAIGECGGAMEESQCPDCGSAIGGTQHRLLQGNAVATEMDGAQRGAWSDEANMDMALARRLQFEIRDRLF